MKKRTKIISVSLFLLLIGFYFLIPLTGNFDYAADIKMNNDAVQRSLINKEYWKRWWPGTIGNGNSFLFESCQYTINKIMVASLDITTVNASARATGSINFFPVSQGNSRIVWKGRIGYSQNPLLRVNEFFKGVTIKKNIEIVLDSMKTFFDDADRVYGIAIRPEKVNDSMLIVMQNIFNHYPQTNEIYGMIDSLRQYISQFKAKQTDSPMLNVLRMDSVHFITMTALPVDTMLPATSRFLQRNMVLGNILTAKVHGGVSAVIEGETQLANFVEDYDFISPAKPYQSLIVNRQRVADTSKWVTKLYYPVY